MENPLGVFLKITRVDREIDAFVYELYELTVKEISIVEGGVES